MPFLVLLFSFLFFQQSAKADALFEYRLREDLGTLDWSNGEVNGEVVLQLMEGLTVSGKNGEPLPALASEWKYQRSAGTSSYVFKLRQDAKWSDGIPVCAQHFIDAWNRVRSPEFASPYAHYLSDVKALRAEGCSTLHVELKREASYFPAWTSHWVFFPVRLDLIQKHGAKWFHPENLVVTGPYLLDSWKRDEFFLLKRNPGYYGKPAFEDALKAVVVPDDASAVSLFKLKKLAWVKDLPFLEKPALAKLPEYRLFPSYVSYHLGFRAQGKDDELDRDSRCALAMALDKRQIPRFLKGGETPAWGLIPPDLRKQGFGPGNEHSRYNLARAKKLWKKGEHVPEEVHFYAKDVHVPLMEWVQEQWRKHLGFKTQLVKSEGKTYWSKLQRDPPKIFLSGITAAFSHPYSFLSEFLPESAANWGHFKSPLYERAANQVAALPAGRESAAWVRLSEKTILDDECAVIPLYFRQSASLISRDWDGFSINAMTYAYLKTVKTKSRPRRP